jgi:hypothetical protein
MIDLTISRAIAEQLSQGSVLMEDTAHPELATALRIGANEAERLISEIERLRAALTFARDLAEEELPFATVGQGHEVALRHIARRARDTLGSADAGKADDAHPR